MNSRSTRFLLLLAIAVAAYIFFWERRGSSPANSNSASSAVLPDFDAATVTGLEFLFGGGGGSNAVPAQIMQADRTNGAWRMSLPVPYPLQQVSVDAFLAALGGLQKKLSVSPAELLSNPRGTTAFGLEPPRAVVILHAGAARSQLRIGNRTPMGGLFYLQILGSQEVYIADARFLESLPRSPNDWRSRVLVDLKSVVYDQLELRSRGVGFQLQQAARTRRWMLAKPLSIRANQAKIEAWLRIIQGFQVEDFIGGPTLPDLDRFGLQAPIAELVFSKGTNELMNLRLGAAPTNQAELVYARLSSLSNVVTVSRKALDFLSLPYFEFVDPQLVAFDTNAVDRIEIQSQDAFALQHGSNGVWRIQGPAGFSPAADPALVAEFFARIARLEIVEVEKDVVTELDFEKYGFSETSPRFTLLASTTNAAGGLTNSLLARVIFGASQAGRILVRRDGDTPVFKAKLNDFENLPRSAFEFRDRRVWRFTTNQVSSVTLSIQGQARRFVRAADGGWSFASGGPGAIPLALEEAILRLSTLQAEVWVARGRDKLPLVRIPELAHSLVLEIAEDGKTRELRLDFGARSPTLAPYTAAVLPGDAEPALFQLNYWFIEPYHNVLKELRLSDLAGMP